MTESDWAGALTPEMVKAKSAGRPRRDHQTSLLKVCARCGTVQEYNRFHVQPASRDGRNSWCKGCDVEARRERRKDPEWRARSTARGRAFRSENPYTWRAGQLNKKAKKHGLPGRVTKAQLEETWERHQGKCFLRGPDCAGDAIEWDHATPVTRYGATGDISNLYPACRSCNAQKNAMTLVEWRRELRWRQLGDGAGWIHPLALVGEPPEHRDYFGAPGLYPEVAASAVVDAFCTVDAGVHVPTRIGESTWLQKRVHVGHDAQIGADCEVCVGVVICGEVRVGNNVKIGGNSWVKPLVEIGDGAIIGGGSVVTKDVPAHEVWAGSPARRQKRSKTHPEYGLCECGCGTATPIAKQSSSRNGWVKGEPVRFVHNHHARRPAEERFWEKVDVPAPDACWEWKAKALPKGYGIFWDGERQVTAHRYSYELHQGPIPEGLWVLHHCDNPPCVNPAHLYAGDNSDNMFDLHERGRARGGQVSPQEAMRRTFEGQERVRPQYDMTPDQWETARMFAYAGGAPSLGEIIEYRKQEWERDHPGPYRPPDGEPHPDWLRGIS